MGCLISILCFIFFPVIYFWYQFRRARKGLDEMVKEQMRRQGRTSDHTSNSGTYNSNGSSREEEVSPGGSGIRKPHIFKPGEGEYVDYKEINDTSTT